MDRSRRQLLQSGCLVAPAVFAGKLVASSFINGSEPVVAAAPRSDATAPLTGLPAGMDPLTVYRQMFNSTENHAQCCWWYLGTGTVHVPDIGDVANTQVETIMVYKTEDVGTDGVKVYWKEIGCFRDIKTGELPERTTNPIDGKVQVRPKSFEDGPAHYTVTRQNTGLSIALEQNHATVLKVAAEFTVADGQVCLTQTEDKVRPFGNTAPSQIQTVLKIYAPLAELQQSGRQSVRASGFYSSHTVKQELKGAAVTGLMQKAGVDERMNPIGWDRMMKAYPDFFKNGKVDPSWS
jgi:hypothetical protein